MLRFGSLRTRILILTTVPVLTVLVATLLTTANTAQLTVDRSVKKSLREASSVFVRLVSIKRNELASMAQVTSRDPRFFATFSIPAEDRGPEFGPTVEGIAFDFLEVTSADFLQVFGTDGKLIAHVDRFGQTRNDVSAERAGQTAITRARRGIPSTDAYREGDRLALAAVSPVFVTDRLEAIVRLGSYLDHDFLSEVRRLTGSNVVLTAGGEEIASTFPADENFVWPMAPEGDPTTADQSATVSDAVTFTRNDVDYLSTHIAIAGVSPQDGFGVWVGRELKEEMAPLLALEWRLALGGLLAVLIALGIAWLAADSITRPLSTVVAASKALRAGNYDHPISPSGNDEVAALAQDFADMRSAMRSYVDHLKEVDQAKSNFIALAGHELRTPLTIISGFNEMIASGSLGDVPGKVKETANVISDQLTGLNRLVQNMLDLTNFQEGLYEFSVAPFDMCMFVRDIRNTYDRACQQRNLTLNAHTPDHPIMVNLDGNYIHQAVGHLLDNAIRATEDGGSITVSVRADDTHAHLTVRDTGVGISPHEVQWISKEAFVDVGDVINHSSGRHRFGSKGFGLGLAITKAIINRHNGVLRVASTPGIGSEFTIVVPRHNSSTATETETTKVTEGVLV